MRIAVIGSNEKIATQKQKNFAHIIGKKLIDEGYNIITGGMGGIMEEIARGAQESTKYKEKSVIAVLPVVDKSAGNPYSGIVIVTDMGTARNRLIILNCDSVLAIGGGAGTLNELALAWEFNKPLAGYSLGGGWAEKLAAKKIDNRRNDIITPVKSAEDVINWLKSLEKIEMI